MCRNVNVAGISRLPLDRDLKHSESLNESEFETRNEIAAEILTQVAAK